MWLVQRGLQIRERGRCQGSEEDRAWAEVSSRERRGQNARTIWGRIAPVRQSVALVPRMHVVRDSCAKGSAKAVTGWHGSAVKDLVRGIA